MARLAEGGGAVRDTSSWRLASSSPGATQHLSCVYLRSRLEGVMKKDSIQREVEGRGVHLGGTIIEVEFEYFDD